MTDQPPSFDINALFQQAQQMSEQLMAAQAAAASELHEGVAGGGAVRVSVTGGMEFQAVSISPSAVDPDDVEMLEDLVLAALRDAVDKAQQSQQGGLDLGGLGGLLGGGSVIDVDDDE